MAKWRRGGGRKRWRWVIEFVPKVDGVDGVDVVDVAPDVADERDPFSYERPEDIVAALWRFEQRKMLEEKSAIADG